MNESKCKTNLIPDVPKKEDLFKGKPHDRLATAIADVISNELGGKTIGLEGGWGSGKSTVIDLLESKLDVKNSLIFKFDAWAHEGDPLRRTFLENLIFRVKQKEWITSKKAVHHLKQLSGRTKKSTLITTPKLEWFGFVVAIATLLIPISLSYLNKSLDAGLVFPWVGDSAPDPYYFVFLILFILPWVFIALVALFTGKGAILIRKAQTETKTITVENPNPTSVEFERIFCKIIKAALSKHNRLLIIVLDNLDRVSPSDAINMLSTLQTFLQYGQQSNGQTDTNYKRVLEKLWVIIPYDRIGFRKIWNQQEGDDIASHMLDKRFQIRFHVPPLVLSNWRKYLLELLMLAFPDHKNQEELEEIYQVINLTWIEYWNDSGKGSSPTPRDLINLVNQIGAFHRQWCKGGMQLPNIAFYATFQYLKSSQQIDSLLNEEKEFPSSKIREWLSQGILDDLAALWFNVDKQIAVQLRLGGRVLEALKQGNADQLRKYAEQTTELWTIIINFTPEIKSVFPSVEELINAVYGIEQSALFDIASEAEKTTFVSRVTEGVISSDRWGVMSQGMGEKLSVLLSLANDPGLVIKVVKMLNSEIPQEDAPGPYQPNMIIGWVDAFLALAPILVKLKPELKTSPEIIIPGTPTAIIRAFSKIAEKDEEKTQRDLLDLHAIDEKTRAGLQTYFSEGAFAVNDLRLLEFLHDKPGADPKLWEEIINSVEARVKAAENESYHQDEIPALFRAVWAVSKYSDEIYNYSKERMQELIQLGYLSHNIKLSSDTSNFEETAWLLFMFFYYMPDPQFFLEVLVVLN